jgi:hypothetical protein
MSENELISPRMTALLTLVEEATRSSEEGVKYFVEPAEDSLRRAISRRHHIVFGRRGSGKSSLLRKAATDLTVDRRPIAWVDLESFKGHSYPDLLISVLIKTLSEFKSWLGSAAVEPSNKVSFWKRWFGAKPTRKPLNRKVCEVLSEDINKHLQLLSEQLHSADDAAVEASFEDTSDHSLEVSGEVSSSAKAVGSKISAKTGAKVSKAASQLATKRETYRRSKIEFLRRHIMDYQEIFRRMAAASDGESFLFLDDLYHLRRNEQARVLDYLHSIAKGNRLWLKVGTIRHRSTWYIHDTPPLGMKLGDDADEIDLDLTLEKYSITKQFLTRILANLSATAGVSSYTQFLTDTGLDRLVLASGGVARDFLAIFRRSVAAARERGGSSPRGAKVGAEDVNVASGEHDTAKREEFKRDTFTDEESPLDSVFGEVRDFCLNNAESNCFLLEKDLQDSHTFAVHELVDLKLLHLIRSRVTINSRQGRIYEAYMLDLSQYAGSRKRRGLTLVEFWRPDSKDQLRKASLILYERKSEK